MARWSASRGSTSADARAIAGPSDVPVLCTGGFQTAAIIREAIAERLLRRGEHGARPLIANNDLVQLCSQRGLGRPPRPCTYCNKCLVNAVENPLGCYDESRFASRDEMVREIMAVFEPPSFR